MQHLDLEQLARLVDEPAGAAEAEHLRGCLVCRRELAELRAQTGALASLADPPVPDALWTALEARLLEEKLVRAPAPARPPAFRRAHLRIAASLALFLAGGAAGAVLWRTPQARFTGTPDSAATPAPAAASRPAALLRTPELAYVTGDPAPSSGGGGGVRLAVNGTAAQPAATPPAVPPRRATAAEADRAARELMQAQAAYMAALQRLAAIADPASGNPPQTRLAALDRLVQLTAEALDRVPGDPVINGYHLAALAERDAVHREMDRDASTEWF